MLDYSTSNVFGRVRVRAYLLEPAPICAGTVAASRWSALVESDSSDSESDDEEDYTPQGFMAERSWRSQTAFPSPEPSKISGSEQAVRDFVRSAPKTKARMVLLPTAAEPVDSATSAPNASTVIASNAALNARVSALLAKNGVVTVFSTPQFKIEKLGKTDESDSSDDDDLAGTKAGIMFRKVQNLLSTAEEGSESSAVTTAATSAATLSAEAADSAIAADTELHSRVDRLLGRTQSAAAKLELQELTDQGVIKPVTNSSGSIPATCNVLTTRRGSYAMVDILSSGKSSSSNEINMVDSKKSRSDLPSAVSHACMC